MYSNGNEQLAFFIIVSLIGFLVFLLCRELVCWYWKVNEANQQRSDMTKILTEMKAVIESQALTNAKILRELEKMREQEQQK